MQLSISYTYLHAERIADSAQGPLNVNLQVTFPLRIDRVEERLLAVDFAASVASSPPAFSVTLKGRLLIQGSSEELGEVERKLRSQAPDAELVQAVTSSALFETLLLLRELGFPPALPLALAPQQRPPSAEFRPV